MNRIPTTSGRRTISRRIALAGLSALLIISGPLAHVEQAMADKWDDKIAVLQAQADEYQAQADKLRAKGDTLQNKLNQIKAQIKLLQTKIKVNQKKHDKLVKEIKANKKKLKTSQDVLGNILANLYVDDGVSSMELLASSQNIGDFVDKQEYRSSVRDQLNDVISEIKKIKAQLESDKKAVDRVLSDLKSQNEQLDSVRAERQQLVDETRGKEAAYQKLVSKNNKQMNKLRAEQAEYFASLQGSGSVTVLAGDPNKGGYPSYLANSGQDTRTDPWGMYNRECVSYAAWKVHQAYGNMPYWGGVGNAWQWAFSGWQYSYGLKANYNTGVWHTANSSSAGIPSGTAPKARSVAVKDANPAAGDPFGHVAWVEQVLGGGKIKISQYNWYNAGGPGWGNYSEMVVDSSFFNKYLYFGQW